MRKVIALLRGINVGGHKKLPMAELRELLIGEGFTDVVTYIQSGNVVFKTNCSNLSLESKKMHEAIKNHFGFKVPVIVKTREDLKRMIHNFPFSSEKIERSYFTIMEGIPDPETVNELSKLQYENEEFEFKNDCLYYYGAAGMGKAKFNHNLFERKLNMPLTTRNYRTMMKLLSLSEE